MLSSRIDRYGDWKNYKDLFQSGKLGSSRPFFEGDNVRERMNQVRKSIVNIRHNWNKFDEFMGDLRVLLEKNCLSSEHDPELTERLSRLFGNRRNWIDRLLPDERVADNYDAVRLYTSAKGYEKIYSFMNLVFRSELSADFEHIVNSVVFLVELINIDLYNYRYNPHTEIQDFNGVVYRGMCLTDSEIQAFSRVCQQPLSERYIAIPLGFHSASLNRLQAESFMERGLKEDSLRIPLLWKIHVISLDDNLLGVYRNLFPTSIVSSICAVPVSGLSDFPYEEEVLLRGPFFQVLNFYEEGIIVGRPLYVLEVVMLNSNRDHPSTAELGVNDNLARSIFGTIVGIRRNQFCFNYCDDHTLQDDANAYRIKLEEDHQQFDKMIDKAQLIIQS